MNAVIQFSIQTLASLILGSDVFTRILAVVQRWTEQEASNAEKRSGVLAEFEIIGLKLLESEANLGIELAVAFLKRQTNEASS